MALCYQNTITRIRVVRGNYPCKVKPDVYDTVDFIEFRVIQAESLTQSNLRRKKITERDDKHVNAS